MARRDEFEELLKELAGGRAPASPSAHFRRACAALGSVPLPAGWIRVLVALSGGHHHLDMELETLRAELAQHDEAVALGLPDRALGPMLSQTRCPMPGECPRLGAAGVRSWLGQVEEKTLLRGPPGWNTLGIDVTMAWDGPRVRHLLLCQPWPSAPPSVFGRRPRH